MYSSAEKHDNSLARSRTIKSTLNFGSIGESLRYIHKKSDAHMWTTATYPLSLQDPKRSLEYNAVVSAFWKKMENTSQEHKDDLLYKIQEDPSYNDKSQYPVMCANVAAALHIGAHLPTVEAKKTILSPSFLYQGIKQHDPLFVALLLQHGSNVHQIHDENTLIFYAQKKDLAELLIKYGALTQTKHIQTLLHAAIKKQYDPNLIPLYRSHGLSPMSTTIYKWTPLMEIIEEVHEHIITKAVYLMQDLSPQETLDLLSHKGMNDIGTVFDIIEREKTQEDNKESIKQLDCLLSILLARRDIAQKTLEQKSAGTQ